jgi:glucose-6-phosphate isomerase
MNNNFPELLQKYNIRPKAKSLSRRLAKKNRFADFSASHGDLLLDFSRTSMGHQTLTRLLKLADASGVEAARKRLFNAEDINFTEKRPALHMAMRSDRVLERLDPDSVARVRANQRRMLGFATAFADGHLPSAVEKPVRHIIHIGIGGSYLGPRLLIEAFARQGSPEVHFLSSVDAHLRSALLARLDPAETAVIIATKSFTTGETLLHARRVKDWMENALGEQAAMERMFAVSGNQQAVAAFGVSQANTIDLPDWVGGRYSIWSGVSLAAAAVMGEGQFAEFLRGAAEMDEHFASAPLAANLPVLAALISVWHRNVCAYPATGVIPYDNRLRSLPSYLQQLVMESNGKSVNRQGEFIGYDTAPVIFGEPGTDAQHSLFQMFHQGSDVVPLCFIGVIHPDHDDSEAHACLLANLLAQATALATGTDGLGRKVEDVHRYMPGERPSEIILLKRLNAHTLGQLLALYEHKVFVESVIWDINAYDQFGVELGKVVARTIQPALEDPAESVPGSYGLDALLAYIRRN